MYHFLLVVGSNISILHRFQDITTLKDYMLLLVTFRIPSVSKRQLKIEITRHLRFQIHM